MASPYSLHLGLALLCSMTVRSLGDSASWQYAGDQTRPPCHRGGNIAVDRNPKFSGLRRRNYRLQVTSL